MRLTSVAYGLYYQKELTKIKIHAQWLTGPKAINGQEHHYTQILNIVFQTMRKIVCFSQQVSYHYDSDWDKKTFNVTKSVDGKSKSLNVEELSTNLKKLVRQAVVKEKDSDQARHILVGKRVRHRYEEYHDGHKILVWYTGRVISQVHAILYSMLSWPNILINNIVKHDH